MPGGPDHARLGQRRRRSALGRSDRVDRGRQLLASLSRRLRRVLDQSGLGSGVGAGGQTDEGRERTAQAGHGLTQPVQRSAEIGVVGRRSVS